MTSEEDKPLHGQRNIKPITDLKPSQKGIIAFLRGGRKVIQRLSDLGLTPRDTEVTLIRKTPMGGPIEILCKEDVSGSWTRYRR